jgi:hypothetical protein
LTAGRGLKTSSSTGSETGSAFSLQKFCVLKKPLISAFMVLDVTQEFCDSEQNYFLRRISVNNNQSGQPNPPNIQAAT